LHQLRARQRFTFSNYVAHRAVSASDCLFGIGDFADSPSHLQHYINRRVGVKLPQHSLLLHCFCRRFDPGGSLDRRVNCRRVPQPRWVGARRSAKAGRSRRETGVRGETRGLRVCPAPRSGALAVGGYKRPRGREREAYARVVPSFHARPTLCKRALVLPFIGVRRGSRYTVGGVAVC
jgi:hypothetical protein